MNKVALNCLVLFLPNSCLYSLALLVHLCFEEMGGMEFIYMCVCRGEGMKWSVLFKMIIEEFMLLRIIWLGWVWAIVTCMRRSGHPDSSNHPALSEIGRDKQICIPPLLLLSPLYSHTYSCHWWLMLSNLEGPVSFHSSKEELWYHMVSDFLLRMYFKFPEILFCSNSNSMLFQVEVFINKKEFTDFSKWKESYFFQVSLWWSGLIIMGEILA